MMSKSGFLDSGGGGTWEKIDFLAHQQLARERARAVGQWIYDCEGLRRILNRVA